MIIEVLPVLSERRALQPVRLALGTLLRQAPERTIDGLWRRIGALLDHFTPSECSNYFRAAGYSDSF